MVRAFLHAILMLLFSFFVLVNFYFLIVCVYLVYDFHNKYIYIYNVERLTLSETESEALSV